MKRIYKQNDLLNQINSYRYILEKNINGKLMNPKTVEMSQYLDKLIVHYYKQEYREAK